MTTTKLPKMQLPATTLADHLALMIHEIRWHQEHAGLTLQGMGEQNVQQATNAVLAAQSVPTICDQCRTEPARRPR